MSRLDSSPTICFPHKVILQGGPVSMFLEQLLSFHPLQTHVGLCTTDRWSILLSGTALLVFWMLPCLPFPCSSTNSLQSCLAFGGVNGDSVWAFLWARAKEALSLSKNYLQLIQWVLRMWAASCTWTLNWRYRTLEKVKEEQSLCLFVTRLLCRIFEQSFFDLMSGTESWSNLILYMSFFSCKQLQPWRWSIGPSAGFAQLCCRICHNCYHNHRSINSKAGTDLKICLLLRDRINSA